MKLQLFGVGTRSISPTISAQTRINCYVEERKEQDKTSFALVGRFGEGPFLNTLGLNPTRGMWAVNTLATPALFVVQLGTLYSISVSGVPTGIGTLNTTSGNVSMVDDGTFLVLVDGTNGWVYNMSTGTFTQITDGNFTTSPSTVTWQDGYFIVTSNMTRQFQLSQISPSIDPTVWPSVQINFSASGSGNLRFGIADHTILELFGDTYTEFWQDAGNPGFPFALITGSAQQFGLAAPFSISQFDNSVVGLFQDRTGALNISRLNGFSLKQISNADINYILQNYTTVQDAVAYSFTISGHPFYLISFPTQNTSLAYDGSTGVWSQFTDQNGNRFSGTKFANFVGKLIVSDKSNGNLYQLSNAVYSDNGNVIPMEVTTKHIWSDDKYISINRIQIDTEAGDGLVSGQGSNPVMDLQVSKDGGNSFYSVGFSSMGKIGSFRHRTIWNTLGAARDWVLKLRITDPIKRIVTGATAEVVGGSF